MEATDLYGLNTTRLNGPGSIALEIRDRGDSPRDIRHESTVASEFQLVSRAYMLLGKGSIKDSKVSVQSRSLLLSSDLTELNYR